MEDPQEDPLAVYCFCVGSGSGVHCWEISLGSADPWNVIFCLFFLVVGFSRTCLLYSVAFLGMSNFVVYYNCVFCVFVVLV